VPREPDAVPEDPRAVNPGESPVPPSRTALRDELAALEAKLQEHGNLVIDALETSLRTIVGHDRGTVDMIVGLDFAADRCYLDVEERCVLVAARQAPVARDLRVVLAVLHVNQHLKRVMRGAVRIATFSEPVEGEPFEPRLAESLYAIGTRTTAMMHLALAAFATRNAPSAASLHDDDDEVDVDLRRALELILELDHADISGRERAMRAIFVARALERTGDHAVAIGDQAAYVATGDLRPPRTDRAERG
jgi:phosphate transport system protein